MVAYLDAEPRFPDRNDTDRPIASIAAGFATVLKIALILCYARTVSMRKSRLIVLPEGVANVTDGDWLYFLDHYASEKYRRYRYFSR